MRKLLFMFSFIFIMISSLIFCASNTMAATKADVISAINATYKVGKKKFRLPAKYIALGEEYLNEKELSSSQYDSILYYISEAVALAREAGTTDYDKLTDEQKKRAIKIIFSAASVADATEELEAITKGETPVIKEDKVESKPVESIPEKNQNDNVLDDKPVVDVIQDNHSNDFVESKSENNVYENKVEVNKNNEINVESSSKDEEKNTIDDTKYSGEIIPNKEDKKLTAEVNEFKNLFASLDSKVKDLLFVGRCIIFVIFIVIILLFYLILRSKKSKIIVCVLSLIFAVIIISLITAFVVSFIFEPELKLLIKLYFMSM